MAVTVFNVPTKIVFGVGSIDQVGKEAKAIGKKAIIVTYPDIRRIGLLDRVIADLEKNGVAAIVFEGVEPNPRSSTIDKAAALAREGKIDLVIGLGGGSAMDSAKGVALACTGTESIWAYVQRRAQIRGPIPPIIQIPTMAGTGSEINNTAVITHWETHIKSGLFTNSIMGKVAIIDPQLTLTVPLKQTKAGAVDIFCHVVEPYVTDEMPAPLTDGIRETVMRMAVKYLPLVIANTGDLVARTELSWASTVAMSSFVRIGGGGGFLTLHGIEHALSGYYDVTHGDGLVALLPAWMRFTLSDRKDRFRLLGERIFGKSDGIRATEEWLDTVGMKLRLRDLGCALEQADEIARLAVESSPWLRQHPTPLDAQKVAAIYRDAY